MRGGGRGLVNYAWERSAQGSEWESRWKRVWMVRESVMSVKCGARIRVVKFGQRG